MDSKPLLLVVDDGPQNIKLLRAILEPAGYAVCAAQDGATALQMAQTAAPALILLDLMMPGMDGFAVCQRLKEMESTRQIPVIVVTGRDDVEAESRCFALGAADYMTKPISLPVVLARVKMHLALDQQRRSLEDRANLTLAESRQQLRALVAQNEAAREEEHKHLAREVHDELGQILTALRMDLSLLDMRFGAIDPALNAKVLDMKGLLDRAIQGVRNVVANLRPTALDMGLIPALENLCAEFAQRSGMDCVFFTREETLDLDEKRTMAVFRIVQESLTNTMRYAGATHVTVTLGRRGDSLGVEVQDNGQGFDPQAVSRTQSFGLLGMRERAIALGGHVDIVSTPGMGATVAVTLPLSAPPQEGAP